MSERNEARRQILSTLLLNSLVRWESFVTLVLTLILFIGVGQFALFGLTIPAFTWLLLGGAAEAVLIMALLSDPQETQEALAKDFESQHNVSHINNSMSRERLRQAMEYRRNLLDLAGKSRSAAMRGRFQSTVDRVNEWISAMYNLAVQIDNFGENAVIAQDLRSVPAKIEKVKSRIERESDEQIKSDLERQLTAAGTTKDELRPDTE